VVVAMDAIGLLALQLKDIASACRLAVAGERLRQEIGGAPSMAVVGERAILDRVRELDPDELARAEAMAPDFSLEQAIALAYSVTARLSEKSADYKGANSAVK